MRAATELNMRDGAFALLVEFKAFVDGVHFRRKLPLMAGTANGEAVRFYRRGIEFLSRYRHVNWAMSDQGMISGINFLTGIVLARYLGLSEFGLYTLAWMAVEFLVTFQMCLIVAPMMSIGPKTAGARRRAYFTSVLGQQAIFAIFSICVFSAVMELIGLLRPDWNLDGLNLPLVCAALAVQLQNFFRRYLFTKNRGGAAFTIDLIRYPVQLAVLFPLAQVMELDVADALWIFTSAAALSAGVGGALFGPLSWDAVDFRVTFRRHWAFAKWLLPSEILRWATTNLYMAVTGAILGTAVVGAVRTAQLLLGVCNILTYGMENFALVRGAEHFAKGGAAALFAYLKRITLFGFLLIGGIALVVAVAPEFWLGLVKSEYQGYGDLVRWWALSYCVGFIALPVRYGLMIIERTRTMFWAFLGAGVASAISVYPMISIFGLTGVMVGIVSVAVLRLALLYCGFRRRLLSPTLVEAA